MSDWLNRFLQVHPPVAMRDHDPKFGPVFARGEGSRLWDVLGNDYIDLTCGYSANNFGQAFAPLVAAATAQLARLTHVTGEPHVGRIELAESLLESFPTPGQRSKVVFNVSGARAVETAWKAAVAFRPGKVLTVGPCFHGRSIATSALGHSSSNGLPQRSLAADVQLAPSDQYPYCAACAWRLQPSQCDLQCVQSLMSRVAQQAASLSAVIVEPAIGARGYISPPAEFFRQLRRVTAAGGVLLIADEIQTGLGRCGHWSLASGQGWQPDLLILGKSLGGGLVPISAVLGRADVLESLPAGSESETYAASPLATAVALEVLSQLRHQSWIERGAQRGAELRDLARRELAKPQWRGCTVEGEGASCIVEFRGLHSGDGPERCLQFARACAQHRVLTHYSGPQGTRSVWLPALTMNRDEQQAAWERLQAAFSCVDTTHTSGKLASDR